MSTDFETLDDYIAEQLRNAEWDAEKSTQVLPLIEQWIAPLSVIQKSLCTQTRASEADWRPIVDSMTPVQKLVHLAARKDKQFRDEFQKRQFDQARETWKQAMQQEINKWGCAGTKAIPPSSGKELSDINERTNFAADSVIGTYNLGLAKEIKRIGVDTPTANRHVYAWRLFKPGGWDQGYWATKNVEVGQNETMVHINAAIEAFYERNGDQLQPEANVVPFSAAEPVCQGIVAGNPYKSVDVIYQKFDLPVHPNCIVPGQKVLTVDGLTNIEDVTVGTIVVTPESNQQVIEVSKRDVRESVYLLEVGDRVLRLTGDHPVRVKSGWLAVQDVQVGDEILCDGMNVKDQPTFAFERVKKITIEKYIGPVHNLTIEQDECYVVNGIVVHNCPHSAQAVADKRLSSRQCRQLWVGG